ncbi:leukocyte antigen CD37 isoform X2 [Octodon degus]|nr:leukocyte antigen CD37 isoform X2 [Octodon degus]
MSAQESCLSLIKYFLFVFNLFFFALGCLIFCFGIWILIDKTSFVSFVGLSFVPLQTWSKILAISGVLTMGLALLGCVGALKELRSLLGLYFGILLLLFATQITVGVLISTQRVRLERRVKELVLSTIQNYGSDPEETAAEESWDYTQFQLRCCGWHSPQDWLQVLILRGNKSEADRVPCSCYNSSTTNDSTVFEKIYFSQPGQLGLRARPRPSADLCSVPADNHIYREGCAKSLQRWLHNNLISIVGICLGIGLLEVSLMVLSLQLHRPALRRQSEPQVPDADCRGASPGLGVKGGAGRCGAATWGRWSSAAWADRAPPDPVPMALGPWPSWDPDETRSTEAETVAAPE